MRISFPLEHAVYLSVSYQRTAHCLLTFVMIWIDDNAIFFCE